MIRSKRQFPPVLAIPLFLAVVLAACSPAKETTDLSGSADSLLADFRVAPQGDTSISNRKFEQVPSIAASADGKVIYVAWYSGGPAPGPGNFVTVSTSKDNGESWVNDQLVVYPKSGSTRFFDPALWRDDKGQVRLYYGSANDSLLWDGFGGVNSVDISLAGSAIKYANPLRLVDGVMSNKPIYIAAKKLTLMPVYVDKAPKPDSADVKYPQNGAFIYSNDQSGLKLYSKIVLPDSIRIHDEPQVVEVSSTGNLLTLLRTTKGIYSVSSSDYGKTWSEPQPFTASGPTTSSRFYIGKLASGNLLLVSNNSTTRNNMTASISKDGGKTWPYQLLLDARENVSYPDADQTPDGNIHVVFDRDRTGAKDILYFRFTEEDVLKGLEGNVFKRRVNGK
ncbi:sialidase family protein [Daejeonella lutea]|uniref:BNR repeat-like domain-containing protein n=1 Tax=Daejeonella lutea TaxID=572036 RepID=A0A1T5ABT0_9SPHI|nr:sialidase family protein [Daejeonella lutea]SKB32386.1 BNR repeat-like domain-containing protein [Daejeonella lutea]